MTPVLDKRIRASLHRDFARTFPAGTTVIDEFAFQGVVADLAIFHEDQIDLVEIKSDADNLKRLPFQVQQYSLIGNSCSLVIGQKHYDAALKLLPEWWGVQLVVERAEGELGFATMRAAGVNPAQSPAHVAQVLWKEEVVKLHRALPEGMKGKSRWTSGKLAITYAKAVSNDDLLRAVCAALRTRKYHMKRTPPKVIA